MAGVVAAVGKEWPATSYEVGREKIREYAAALAIDAGIHRDHDAARAAGFRAVVAPPAFAAVYVARSLAGAPSTARLWVTSSRYDDRGEPPRDLEAASPNQP